jgi:hypothetical protein
MELDERLGFVEAYLSKLLPEDWVKMDTFDRQAFIADAKAVGTIARTEVSVAEVWVECLGKKREDITKYNTRDVNDILKILGWQFNGSVRAVQHYGRQRIFYKPKP